MVLQRTKTLKPRHFSLFSLISLAGEVKLAVLDPSAMQLADLVPWGWDRDWLDPQEVMAGRKVYVGRAE